MEVNLYLSVCRFIMCLTISYTTIKGCEEGWDMFGEKCYLFSFKQYGWEDAKEYCETLGASLVKVEDEGEHAFVRRKLSEVNFRYAWIGARYFPKYGEHRWLDESEMTYDGWAPVKPGTSYGCSRGCVDYLQIYDYRWNCHCDCVYTKGPFICEKGCQDGWNMFGNKCYLFSESNHSWEDAEANCESKDGNLVIVDTDEEHEYIRLKLSGVTIASAWIGARFDPRPGEHRWLDDTSITVDGWGSGRPGNTKGCVEYLDRYDYLWNSRWDCVNRKIPSICEKRCDFGWEKFGNKCYLLSHVYRGWEDAKSYCETVGASLAKVENDLEHQFIRGRVKAANLVYLWIGARYDPDLGEHRWLDGSPMAFNGWAPGLPGNEKGCVDYLQKFDYEWNSHCNCIQTRGPFICQKDLNVLYGALTFLQDISTSVQPTESAYDKPPTISDVTVNTETSSSDLQTTTFRMPGIDIDVKTSRTQKPSSISHKSTIKEILPTPELPDVDIDIPLPDIDMKTVRTQEPSSDSHTSKIKEIFPTPKLPDVDIEIPVTDSEQDSPGGSISRIVVDEEDHDYVCNPDDSIEVYNLPENSFYFAIQNVTSGSDIVCNVTSINATAVKVTGCSKDFPILLSYGSYSGMASNLLHGGKNLTAIKIMCAEISDDGVIGIINETFGAVLTLLEETDMSPTYEVTSSLNNTEPNVGDPVAWTIYFPGDYVLEVSECNAEPGTVNRTDMKVSLVSKGGCNMNSDLISNFTDNSDGTATAIITAFMFYNDANVLLKCNLLICPEVDTQTCDTACSRQKRDVRQRTYRDPGRAYLASVSSYMHVTDSHSGVSKLDFTLSLMVTSQSIAILFMVTSQSIAILFMVLTP